MTLVAVNNLHWMRHLFTFIYLFVARQFFKTGLLSLVAIAALPLTISGQVSESIGRDVFMYRNKDSHTPVSIFSPKDKIVARIILKKVPKAYIIAI